MNWAVVLAYNNVHLTKAAVASLQRQDIEGGVQVLVVDNNSKDSTGAWLDSRSDLHTLRLTTQDSVAGCWNRALRWLFIERGETHALVVNNDAVLRPDAYRWLVADGGLFVTCVGKRDPKCVESYTLLPPPTLMHHYQCLKCGKQSLDMRDVAHDHLCETNAPDPAKKRPHPDFSCYLMRRECFERVGEFDENFKRAFYEDNSYHLRMHRAGVHAECLELPFYHYGSATIKHCDIRERVAIQRQAQLNKEYFKEQFGFDAGSPEYYAAFGHQAPVDQSGQVDGKDDKATVS